MLTRRTDLALEACELWRENAGNLTKLPGVRSRERKSDGYPVTKVEILDKRGEEALGRPVGTYVTADLRTYWKRGADYFPRAVRAVGRVLKALLADAENVSASHGGNASAHGVGNASAYGGNVSAHGVSNVSAHGVGNVSAHGGNVSAHGGNVSALVVGLGNADMTPDSVGPLAVRHVLVTRHLLASMPRQFAGLRPVAAFCPGVLGTTGVETAEAVRGLVERVRPSVVIAIDALASRRRARLCAAVQLSDTGILPGSGVGNRRAALNRETLGVPALAVGVPTVVDAVTLAADLLEERGHDIDESALRDGHDGLTVTPSDIDAQVKELARVVGYGVNWALQDLEVDDISALLS